jgi:hypothetical protein
LVDGERRRPLAGRIILERLQELFRHRAGRIHSHFGYGIDDPKDEDLAPLQIAKNETVWANLIWDWNKHLRFAWELTYRKTDYAALRDNEGLGAHTQVQWKF